MIELWIIFDNIFLPCKIILYSNETNMHVLLDGMPVKHIPFLSLLTAPPLCFASHKDCKFGNGAWRWKLRVNSSRGPCGTMKNKMWPEVIIFP